MLVTPQPIFLLPETSEYPGPLKKSIHVGVSKCGSAKYVGGMNIISVGYAGRCRWKTLPRGPRGSSNRGWVGFTLMLVDGLPVFTGPHSSPVWWRDGAGLFLLILLSSTEYLGFQFPPLSSSSSPFPAQCTSARWPRALISLSHVLAYSFGLSIINNNDSFHPHLWPVWALSDVVALILPRLVKEVIVWVPSLSLQSAVTAQTWFLVSCGILYLDP